MQTRSQAKKMAEQVAGATGGIQRTGTVVQTGPSATGEGTHKRWIYRPVDREESLINQRFITPAPTMIQVNHGAPRKSTDGQRNRATTPGSPLGTIQEQGPGLWESDSDGSPTSVRYIDIRAPALLSPMPPLQQIQPASTNTNMRELTRRRPALGPCGTFLFTEEGNQIFIQRVLGPSGTIILSEGGAEVYEEVEECRY